MSSRLSDLPEGQEGIAQEKAGAGAPPRRLANGFAARFAYAAIALVAAGFIAVAVQTYVSVSRELTEVALARRSAVAQLAAATLSERLDRMVDLGVSLATRVRFAELVAAGQWQPAVQILQKVPAEFPLVDRVVLYDVHGTVMADLPDLGTRGKNFAFRDWYQGVSRHWKPYVSEVYLRAAAPRRQLFAVTVPVTDRSGAPSGLLQLQINLDTFFDWAKAVRLSPGASAYVVDARGTAVFHSTVAVGERLLDLSATPGVTRLLRGGSGVEIDAGGGEERVYAYMAARHGWGVVVEQPASAAFAARDKQLRRLLVGYAVIFLACAAIVALGIDRLQRARGALERRSERLRILHEIDRGLAAREPADVIAGAVIRPLRELLGAARATVNVFHFASGEVEWLASAGRRRTRTGTGERYPIEMVGDVDALRRGEPQVIETHELPAGAETSALLASGVSAYMVVPMIAGGELIGALNFGGERKSFPAEQIGIAREVATQLAIAIMQSRLVERVERHAGELEQRVAERTANLDAANRELEDLYNKAPCGYHSVDAQGTIVRMNDTWLAWLGYRRDEVVGRMKHPELMTPESAARFWAEAFPKFKRDGVLESTEFEYRRKDGSTLTGSLNATTIYDDAGRLLMSRSTVFDVSERKQREREMQLLHAAAVEIGGAKGSAKAFEILLRTVCEYTGWCFAQVWMPDATGSRLELAAPWYCSVADLAEFRRANEQLAFAPEGTLLEQVWKSGQLNWVWDLQADPRAARRTLMIEARLRSWIGFPVLADGAPIAVLDFFDRESRSRDDRVLTLISILATQIGPAIQRKRVAEQIRELNASLEQHAARLEEANKELESFSYSVSHDLRAPLRAVDGYARMLEEDYGERLDEEGRRLLGVVRESSNKMGQLIDDLLAFSRLGRQAVARQTVDMTALAGEALDEVRRDWQAEIEIGTLPPAMVDRKLFKQVWLNLIANALKYSSRSARPRVEVGGAANGAQNMYWVRDNGVGFDMRYAEKLFGVFQRLHGADEFPGTGVGLAIVQRVVTRHGGRIWAEAKPGEGACFYFTLPRQDA